MIRRICQRELVNRFGGELIREGVFVLNDRKYRVNFEVLALIDRILSRANSYPYHDSLLRFRPEIRRILRFEPRALLTYLAKNESDNESRCLMIWLRGRCRGSLGAPEIAKFIQSEDSSVRWRTVHALRQMQAWSLLREIEQLPIEARLRKLAQMSKVDNFDTRMTAFLNTVDARPVDRLARHLVITEHASFSKTRNQKPASFIRMILERIQRLVRGIH